MVINFREIYMFLRILPNIDRMVLRMFQVLALGHFARPRRE